MSTKFRSRLWHGFVFNMDRTIGVRFVLKIALFKKTNLQLLPDICNGQQAEHFCQGIAHKEI